jgi:uncharacterized NAD-dependent epimerase/dehydratase family protein
METETTKPNAIIVTNGALAKSDGKTAHGLIRGTDRFNIIGVIDPVHAGEDAGIVLDGKHRSIPIYGTIADCVHKSNEKSCYCIIGVAFPGGRLPQALKEILIEAMANHMSIVNGLHQTLGDDPEFKAAAGKYEVKILDIRKPLPFDQLHFWSGDIYKVKTPKIVVLGMDCAVGKRTTCRYIMEMCRESGLRVEMIFTGQTGWMQGYPHGFIFDATPNDFVCGELEHAIVDCDRQCSPDLILIEGQASLRNPSGPCGSEFLLSGNAKGVILQHVPFRSHFEDMESMDCRLPSIEDEISLISMYGATVLAVTLNESGADNDALAAYQKKLSKKLSIPVVRPRQEGVEMILPAIEQFMQKPD